VAEELPQVLVADAGEVTVTEEIGQLFKVGAVAAFSMGETFFSFLR